MATQVASKSRVLKGRNQVLKSVKNINCMVVDFTEDMIDETLETGTKYQKLAVKVIRKSEPIIEKQVDLFFDTAELALEQIQDNSKRLQKLLGITKTVNKATKTVEKIVKSVSEKVEEGMDTVEKNVNTLKTKGKKTITNKAKPQARRARKTVAKRTQTVKGSAAKSVAKATKAIKAPVKKRVTKATKAIKTTARRAPSKKVAS